jgi:xanthine dehydrogenase accessory factor
MFADTLILIKGAGDLASGVAARLFRAGFPLVMTEMATPLAVRRAVAFAEAIYAGSVQVEEIHARRCSVDEAVALAGDPQAARRAIPVVVDPGAMLISRLRPAVVIDAVMAKVNTGTSMDQAPVVVALGPGFTVGRDCHAVVETNRGHNLGRVIWHGAAEPDTGAPGELAGVPPMTSRVLRAPADGHVVDACAIGARVAQGEIVAHTQTADGRMLPMAAPFDGVLRGIIHPRVAVQAGMKVGDLDPRLQPENCRTISDKSLAIGGGVLEAVLMLLQKHEVSATVAGTDTHDGGSDRRSHPKPA